MEENVELTCSGCGCSVNGSLHTCPYQMDINNSDCECNCCDSCINECAMDI